jgi:hypothetical protein
MKTAEAILSVKFNSTYSLEELNDIFISDLKTFRSVAGLIQKYFIADECKQTICAIYLFETKTARAAFRISDLAKGLPARYGIIPDTLQAEYYDILIVLNEVAAA